MALCWRVGVVYRGEGTVKGDGRADSEEGGDGIWNGMECRRGVEVEFEG